MNQGRWQSFLDSAHNPPSLTSQEKCRVDEAEASIEYAVRNWDRQKPVLVLGCGDGEELNLFKARGFNATGVTFHKDEIRGGFDIIEADIHDLPIADSSFYYTYSRETLEHLLSPFIGVFEIATVMPVGGQFCHFISAGVEKQREWYHFSAFPDYVWVDLFQKAGLRVESVRNVVVSDQKDIQIVLEGAKERHRDLTVQEEGYGLRELLNRTRGSDLELIDHRQCDRSSTK